jgi:GT2 family glycosyltransferase
MNSTTNLPLISVIIPNHNRAAFLANCLRSLHSQNYPYTEIIVVDNASQDESLEVARTVFPTAILISNNRNLGFAGGVNTGIRSALGDWVAVLNNDTEVAENWLFECARAIEDHPDAGFFACRILQFSDPHRVYSAGDCYLRAGIGYRRGQDLQDREDFRRERRIFSASGCAALYRKEILEDLGGFDDRFFAYLEDVDLGLRLQSAGYHGYYLPRAEVFHHGGATSGGEFSQMAVRLRTRNSLLLLLKSTPWRFLVRCFPMILLAQLWWMFRVLAHHRVGSYLRGIAEACLLVPAMIRDRAKMRPSWKSSMRGVWEEILNSESLAHEDFVAGSEQSSVFLKYYFRLFGKKCASVT